MELSERYNYLNDLLEEKAAEYANDPQFLTKLEIASLEEEFRQLSSEFNEYLREQIGFYEIYPFIRKASMKLIEKLGDKGKLPIDVRKIAVLCKFDGIELDDGRRNVKHAITRNNIIYLNGNEPEEEQRFSIAHEIGHKIFDLSEDSATKNVARMGNQWKANVLKRKSPIPVGESETFMDEEIIDYFAANLLMPTHIFKNLSDQPDEVISRKFCVSEKSVQKRRIELANEIQKAPPCNGFSKNSA
jgi:Zn-dependent peptidase ImmA (M78 family)